MEDNSGRGSNERVEVNATIYVEAPENFDKHFEGVRYGEGKEDGHDQSCIPGQGWMSAHIIGPGIDAERHDCINFWFDSQWSYWQLAKL